MNMIIICFSLTIQKQFQAVETFKSSLTGKKIYAKKIQVMPSHLNHLKSNWQKPLFL